MRILIISRFFPYPDVTHSGGTDLFHYIKAMKLRDHQISIASFIKKNEYRYIEDMGHYCEEINVVPALSSFGQRVLKAPALLRFPLPWVEAISWEMKRVVGNMLTSRSFDIVHFEHLWTTQYFDRKYGYKTVLDEVDVDSVVFFRMYQKAKTIPQKLYYLWCWVRTVQLEVKACNLFDLVFVKSEKDRVYLNCLAPGRNIRILAPWFEGMERHVPENDAIERNCLLFVGNMSRAFNIQAAEYFCNNVLPLVTKDVPDVKFYIVGDAPPEQVRRLANDHVIVTGHVDDVWEYYIKCQVFVAPILVGGGIIVKILDALAAGRPVVCTTVGNEGIGGVSGVDLFVANSPVEFSQRIIELFLDAKRWDEMSRNARRFFKQRYNWNTIVSNLENAYLSIL